MGSIIGVADDTGQAVASFEYDSFGNIRNATGPESSLPVETVGDYRFHGAWLDTATGFYHMRVRHYDPKTGRFISRDPVEGEHYIPESLHPYTYANNNPHIYRDPTGLVTLLELNTVTMINRILATIQTAGFNILRQLVIDTAKGA